MGAMDGALGVAPASKPTAHSTMVNQRNSPLLMLTFLGSRLCEKDFRYQRRADGHSEAIHHLLSIRYDYRHAVANTYLSTACPTRFRCRGILRVVSCLEGNEPRPVVIGRRSALSPQCVWSSHLDCTAGRSRPYRMNSPLTSQYAPSPGSAATSVAAGRPAGRASTQFQADCYRAAIEDLLTLLGD